MKKQWHYSSTQINSMYRITLEELIDQVTRAKDQLEANCKAQGFEPASTRFSLDGDSSSYGSSAYIQVDLDRYETDKEEQDRLDKEKLKLESELALKEKKKLEAEKKELEKQAKLAAEALLMQDPDYSFYKELEAKLKREGKLK